MSTPAKNTVGSGDFVYEPARNWFQLPDHVRLREAVGVAVDSADNLFVFNRGEPAVIVLDPQGQYVRHWGEGLLVRPHGISIDADDNVYLADDKGHRIQQFTPVGELIRSIGPVNDPAATGIIGMDYRKITQGGPPYNMPTNTVRAPNEDLYVSDGYGNARVHRFSPDGELKQSWGEPGSEPGHFNVPHGIGADSEGRIYVADRENSRVQIFSPEGQFLEEWTDVVRPCQVFVAGNGYVYVGEMGSRVGLFEWLPRPANPVGARISIRDTRGKLHAEVGGGNDPHSVADVYTAHDVCVDSVGNMYVGEVALTAQSVGVVNVSSIPSLRKFVKVA